MDFEAAVDRLTYGLCLVAGAVLAGTDKSAHSNQQAVERAMSMADILAKKVMAFQWDK